MSGSYKLTRPCARYVRRRCLGAWLTWMCLMIKLLVSSPLVSALASAFFKRPSRNSADLTGHRALETPNCFPMVSHQFFIPRNASSHMAASSTMGFVHTLGSTASAPSISPHGNSLSLCLNIVEVCFGALEFPAVDGLGGLAGVLERDLCIQFSHAFAFAVIAASA
jgi:hypothetical protein